MTKHASGCLLSERTPFQVTVVRRCYDTKATNWHMAAELQSLAVVGPPVQVDTPPSLHIPRPPAAFTGPCGRP